MGFFSFLGRVLFASIFILSAWQMYNDFGLDGGPAAKELDPKLVVVKRFLASKLGQGPANIDVKHVVAASLVLKGAGGLIFVFGSPFGAYLLMFYLLYITPILFDFYNYKFGEPQFFTLLQDFLQNVALFGALLYFLGMKGSISRRKLKKKAPKSKAA
nr:HR-like lesion-inducer [Ipomoea batatas]